MDDIAHALAAAIGEDRVLTGGAIVADYTHDESLTIAPEQPAVVVTPADTADVAAILQVAVEHDVPVTARGTGTGLSGSSTPVPDGVLVSFERMAAIVEIDTENHTVTVQPGVTLQALDEAVAAEGLVYPVFPGEYSASLGGNVNTNAGGMRAVRYGVTRNQVLGLEAVLPTGEVIRTGGKHVKVSSGYDLTQLIIGSEGTLALVTEATLRLYPRLEKRATVLAPFATLEQVATAVPRIVASGIGPLLLEYIDMLTMAAITHSAQLELGIPEEVRQSAQAYLVVALEERDQDRLDGDVQELGEQLVDLGATDVYVLPSGSADALIQAREKAFWVAKGAGADDIVDVVVPRAQIAAFLDAAREIGQTNESLVTGCGHAGDGNVHLSIFQPDPDKRAATMRGLFEAGVKLGGAISGEHGIGRAKKPYWLELEDPAKVGLMRRIKAAFDPTGILNPGVLFD